jgi:cytoskeleton protein RodZ
LTLIYLFATPYERRHNGAAEVPNVPARLLALVDAHAAQQAAPVPGLPEAAAIHAATKEGRAELRPERPLESRVAAVVSPILANRVALQAAPGSGDGVWVRVRVAQSRESVMDRVLRPGEIWQVPPRDGLVLDTGKAHELRMLVDGAPVPAPEGFRGVRRNVAVTDLIPESLGGASAEVRTVTRPTALANR